MSLAFSAANSFERLLESTGRFRLLRRLGQGGSGCVYRVHDAERGEDVALKALSVPSGAAIYQLKREFRALADVTHPNLAVLHELLTVGDEWCFTMEVVDGVDFFSYVSGEPDGGALESTGALPVLDRGETPAPGMLVETLRRGHCDLNRLRRSFEQLVAGVHALHLSGHLHLDLKPGNVIVARDGRVVVLDFGLVRETEAGRTYSDPTVAGTPAYMAPEQVAAQQPSPATDWYAVGSVLYEALTGVQPYSGHAVAVLMSKMREDPPPPESVVPGVPREWAELCKRMMDRRPEARPGYEQIQAWLGATPTAQGVSMKPGSGLVSIAPFVGRNRPLEVLERAREAAFQGAPRVVLVHGPSGIGKTALMHEFMRRAGMRRRAFVLEGRCFERESVPYKALDSVIDALSRVLRGLPAEQAATYAPVHADALVRVFPVLARVPALAPRKRFTGQREQQQERALAFQALKSLLVRMSDDRPVVMFIDDLQWGDRDSALLVRELLTPPDPPRLLLLGTHRNGEESTSPFLSAFADTSSDSSLFSEVERVALSALDRQESEWLVHAMLEQEGHDRKLAQLIASESEGNPFFAGELVRSARGRAAEPRSRVPLSLDQVLLERFAALPVNEQALLEIITVIGRPVDRALVRTVSGLGGAANAGFDALRSARLIRTRGAREAELVEPCHDRIREVVSSSVAPARRAIVHAMVAREIEARGNADTELLMLHYTEAGDTARAAQHAVSAARAASASLAFDHAARLLRKALELVPDRPAEELVTLHAELGHALEQSGRSAEASEAFLHAAQHARPAHSAELRLRAGEQLLLCGRYVPGIALLREVLPEFGVKLSADGRSALWSLLWQRARLAVRGVSFVPHKEKDVPAERLRRIDACYTVASSLGAVDSLVAADVQTKGVLLALDAGEPMRVLRALIYESGFRCGSLGGQPRTLALLDKARILAKQIGRPEAQGMLDFGLGFFEYHGAGDMPASAVTLARSENVLLDTPGMNAELAILRLTLVTAFDWMGDVRTLDQRLPGLRADAERRGDHLLFTSLLCAPLFWLARDAVADLELYIESSRKLWPSDAFVMPHYWLMVAEAHRDLYVGDGKACVERVVRMRPELEKSYYLSIPTVRVEVLFPRARGALMCALAGHEPGAMLRQAEADMRAIAGSRRSYAEGLAALLRASIASVRGQRDALPGLLAQAAEACKRVGFPVHAAVAEKYLGELLAGDEGKRLTQRAERTLRELGVHDLDKIARALAPGFVRER